MKERDVEDLLVASTDAIGYGNAPLIRNYTLVPGEGRADVVLFPEEGVHRLVIIEVKLVSAKDAIDKVIGQLLKYYANAMTFGVDSVDRIREFARDEAERCKAHGRITPNMIFKQKGADVGTSLTEGRPLLPQEIGLFVAMNGEPGLSLKRILTALAVHHSLPIGVICVEGKKKLRVLVGSDASDRMR